MLLRGGATSLLQSELHVQCFARGLSQAMILLNPLRAAALGTGENSAAD